jgi:hypothetical protein
MFPLPRVGDALLAHCQNYNPALSGVSIHGGCGGKALLRKKAYRLPKRFLVIELLRSLHAPVLFRCSRSDYAMYPPSMVSWLR